MPFFSREACRLASRKNREIVRISSGDRSPKIGCRKDESVEWRGNLPVDQL
jgi:hypothetical protein